MDALVLTGEISKPGIDLRVSQGVHLIVPAGCNETAIRVAGLKLGLAEDTTAQLAVIAQGLHDARARHEADLRQEEDADWFDWRQRFLATTAELAASRRMSRFLYLAEKPLS